MPADILPGCPEESPIPDFMGPLSVSSAVLSAAQNAARQTIVNGITQSQQTLDGMTAAVQAGIGSALSQSANVLNAAQTEAAGTIQTALARTLTTAQDHGIDLPQGTRYVNQSGQPEAAVATGEIDASGMAQWVMPDGSTEIASIQDINSRNMLTIAPGPLDIVCDQAYDAGGWAVGHNPSSWAVVWNTDPPGPAHVQTFHTSGPFRFHRAQAESGYVRLTGACPPGDLIVVDPFQPPLKPPIEPPVQPPVLPPLPPGFPPVEPPVLPPPVNPPPPPPPPPRPPQPPQPCPPPIVNCPAPQVVVVPVQPCPPGTPPGTYPPPVVPPVVPPVEPPAVKPPVVPAEKHACPDDPDYHIQICADWTEAVFEQLVPGLGQILWSGRSGWQLMDDALQRDGYGITSFGGG